MPTQAQTPRTNPDGDTIIVTGKSLNEEDARAQSLDFIRSAAAEPVGGQFARWNRPICPKVIGIDRPLAAAVEDKVRTIASEAGAELGKLGCKANLLIVFTDDAGGQMRAIVKERPRLLGNMPAAEREALIDDQRAVRWWYGTKIEGADGKQAGSMSPMLLGGVIAGGSGFETGDSPNIIDSRHATLIGTKVRATMVDAGVLIDVDRAEGHTLDAVAAYVSMVSLARVKLSVEPAGGETILNLFSRPAGQSTIKDLTQQDRAFLAALYKVRADRNKRAQRGAIVAEMVKSLSQR